MSVQIEPFSLGNITSFTVSIYQVVLFVKARLTVALYDNGTFISVKDIDIEGEDYLQWPQDDNYIINYVCNKLGFTLKPEHTPSEPTPTEPTPSEPTPSEPTPTEPTPTEPTV
jgi:hypothetical protein